MTQNCSGRWHALQRSLFKNAGLATDLNQQAHREAYRSAFAEMLKALPTNPDPAATWDAAFWNNLVRTQELGGNDYGLLDNLFTRRLQTRVLIWGIYLVMECAKT